MKLIEHSLKYGVTVAVGVILVLMFGILSLLRVPIQLTPDVTQPELTVTTTWPGASPEEVERDIIDQQEKYLKSVPGLTEIRSTAQTGLSEINLQFQVGSDIREDMLRTLTAIKQVPSYPENVDEPVIQTVNVSDRPIGWFVLQPLPGHEGKIDVYHYRDFATDNIKSRFERVAGVSQSSVFGGSELEVRVTFDPNALAERAIGIYDLREALRRQNHNVSGGDFDEGKRRYIIRTTGEFTSPEDIEKTIVSHTNGRPVYVKDVARVHMDYAELRSYVRHNGLPGIAVNAQRALGSNILQVMKDLQETQRDLNENLLHPMGLHLVQTADATEYIAQSIKMVQTDIVIGGALAIVILLIFLRSWFSTLVIALAIPISVVGSFLIITLMGRSINVIMLAGMAFSVGMVVDASIVVLENIHRHRHMGKNSHDAALDATTEVWGAILASTLTHLTVFIPILFIQEEVGQMFRDIAVAVSATIFLSMIVSVLVIPPLSARLLRYEEIHAHDRHSRIHKMFLNMFGLVPFGQRFNQWVTDSLRSLFRSLKSQAMVIVLLTVVPLGIAWKILPKAEYLPEGDQNVIFGMMIPPQGYNIQEMTRIGNQMEEFYRPYWLAEPGSPEEARLKGPAVRNFLYIGREGNLFTVVKARDPERAKDLVPVLKQELGKVPGMISVTRQLSLFTSAFRGSRGIEINIMGPDMSKLSSIAQNAFFKLKKLMPEAQIRPVPGMELGQPQIKIFPRMKEIAETDATVYELGYSVAALVDGVYADKVYMDPEKVDAPYVPRYGVDLVLKSREHSVDRTQDISSLVVHTRKGNTLPLASVAELKETVTAEQIQHFERRRAITLEVVPPPQMPLEEGIDLVKKEIIQPLKDDGTISGQYAVQLTGNADKLDRMKGVMSGNLLLAVFITYLFLVVLLQHWGYPFIIMLSVPTAAVGGVVGLWFLNLFFLQPLDVLTMLGFVILVGVVANNAILIVYQSLNNVRYGLPVQEAILESVRTRIRPIFMTSLTSIFGLLPLVAIPGAGSEIYRGIGVVLLSGLLFSAVFTLFLIPCLMNLAMLYFAKQRAPATGSSLQIGE
ncbi:MAG: efflux RND transporter permease subunit [Nitrospinae bacterium]|nr:efflux RND transporter permease subunit [Nitrospinota bacterium]